MGFQASVRRRASSAAAELVVDVGETGAWRRATRSSSASTLDCCCCSEEEGGGDILVVVVVGLGRVCCGGACDDGFRVCKGRLVVVVTVGRLLLLVTGDATVGWVGFDTELFFCLARCFCVESSRRCGNCSRYF